MAHPGEQHREARLVGRRYDFIIADRSTRLDHRRRARLDRSQQTIGEREESVGGNR